MTDGRKTILLYHGLRDRELGPVSNYHGNQMAVAQFVREMEYLAGHFRPVSLTELLSGDTVTGKPPVAVTFDDGDENNHALAYPILQQFHIPATIFLAAGFIGTGRILWTNVVERAFDATAVRRFEFAAGGETRCYNIWFTGQKRAACRAIKQALKQLDPQRAEAKVDELLDALKVKRERLDLSQYRMLNWEQARGMDPKLVEFGSHTVNHCILTAVPEPMARFEIEESKRMIEAGLGRPVRHFCYPNGNHDEQAEQLAKNAGYTSACTTKNGSNNTVKDNFRLERMWRLDGSSIMAL